MGKNKKEMVSNIIHKTISKTLIDKKWCGLDMGLKTAVETSLPKYTFGLK